MVQQWSVDRQGSPGQVKGPVGKARMVCWTIGEVLDGRVTYGEVWDGSKDPRGGLGQVGGTSGWSRTVVDSR